MAKWYAIPRSTRMSEGEYEANIQGINIVFGAVLGFVLAGANDLPQREFAVLLFLSAGAVTSILYLAHSQYKLFYGVTTALLIYLLPHILADPFDVTDVPQLQPTLAVWAAMIFSVAFLPRDKQPATEVIETAKKDPIP